MEGHKTTIKLNQFTLNPQHCLLQAKLSINSLQSLITQPLNFTMQGPRYQAGF